jgi:hypothetical protein
MRARVRAPGKDAPFVYIVKTDIPADIEVDFNDWYEKEHVPALASVPGCLRARQSPAVDGQPVYTAVYELETPDVIKSAAWAKARDTAWSGGIRPHMQNLKHRVYQLILPAN